MDFALKELHKYGWTKGSGLGRNEDGINNAIKPKLKFDNAGLGHNIGEEFTNNWWENAYNDAAKKINENDPASKSTTIGNQKKALEYGHFIKTGTLTEKGFESSGNKMTQEKPQKSNKSVLTDEALWAACGGRTVHKGARHGLKMNGKLSRLEKQEKLLLKKMKHCSLSDEDAKRAGKLKKLRKNIDVCIEKNKPLDTTDSNSSTMKKRNKPKKKVSFNEIISEVVSGVLDLSFESEPGSLRDEISNDEGIEHDSVNKECSDLDSDANRAFEEPRSKFCDLSKAEQKKLKKKRKLASRDAGTNATSSFLLNLTTKEVDNPKEPSEDNQMDNTKRKRHDELDKDNNSKRCHKEKKKERKKKKFEARLSDITKSFEGVCNISQDIE